jgi:hypothetical protein
MSSDRIPTDLEDQPLPLPGTVLFRSVLTGFVAGALIGGVIGSFVAGALLDVLYFGMFGAAIGAIYGAPVGLLLGLFMAVWFRVADPRRSTVRLTVTVLSIFVAVVVLVGFWPNDGLNLKYLPIPFVGVATWFGLLLVLKPSRPDAREDQPSSEKFPEVAWDRDVGSDG